MANSINILIQAKDEASKTLRSISQEMDNGSAAGGRFSSALKSLGMAAKAAAVSVGVAATAFAGFAVSSAADYEQSLNIFRSVSNATVQQMTEVGETAKRLGSDMTLPGISAKDAALAMVELSKAGMSVNDTLAASKGVLSLAKAGQVETAFAAEVTANALNAFNLAGTEASKVADMLAGGANGSSASIQDLALGMQMASASASTLQMPIDDLISALGLMSNNALKGSDAGTSLKTFMSSLTPVTTRQKDAMRNMNLQFYDAQGNFVGLRDAARQLQDGTKGMSTEQKLLNLEMAFGSDAMRSAAILAKEGAAGYDKMSASVKKQGAATELAAAQNAGFNGALDALQSNIETVAIEVGLKMLPALTDLVKYLASNVEPTFNSISETVKEVVNAMSPVVAAVIEFGRQASEYLMPKLTELWSKIQNDVIPVLQRLWFEVIQPLIPILGVVLVAAFGAVVDAVNILLPIITGLVTWMIDNKEMVVGFGLAIAGVGAAMKIGEMVTTFQTNLGLAKDAVRAVSDDVGGLDSKLKTFGGWATFAGLAGLAMTAVLQDVARVNAEIDVLDRKTSDSISETENLKKKWQEGKISKDDYVKALNEGIEKSQQAGREADVIARKYDVVRAAWGALTGTGHIQAALDQGELEAIRKQQGRALGSIYAPGGRTLVGEHGPELVDLPRGSQVTQAYRTRSEMMSGGDNVTIHISGDIYNQTPEAANAFWDRVDKASRLSRFGMAGGVAA